MSNAFTNFISNLRASAESRPSLIGAEPQAKLIGVPLNVRDEVVNTRQVVRVKGEVVQAKADGTVRVRTERGDVEFRPAEGQRVPKEGQQVEIEIPPNVNAKKAPEIVNYRRLPDAQQQQGRPSGTPVEVDVHPERSTPVRPQTPTLAQPPSPPVSQPLPPEGADIRLQPLPPQTPLAPYEPLEQIAAQLTPITPEQLLVIVQNAQSDLQETLATLQTPKTISTEMQTPVLKTLESLSPTPGFEPVISSTKDVLTQNAPVLSDEKIPAPLAPEQKTLLENLFQGLPKLPVDILQKIAFGKTAPAIVTQSSTDGAFVPSAIPVKAQIMDVTLAGKLTPGIELKPQIVGDAPLTTPATPKLENMILENQKAGTITGVVTNITQSKQPVISVFFPSTGSEQMFTLPFVSEQITVGTHIQMMPQTSASPLPSALPVSPGVVPLPVLLAPQPWPLMDEIYQSLAQASPQAAQAFSNIVPTPANPANMSPAILFFVAAVRGGDMSQWLGDKTIETLKSVGKSGLLSRLTQEGGALNRIAADPVSPDWRAVNLPMFAQGEMQKIALYYRHEYEDENEEQGKTLKGTRFVFDLKLDAMGKVQLDGLFRPVSDAGKRLDLVVRTEQFFSQATQMEMRRVYTRALHDTGVGGELTFQNRPETWVSVSGESNTLTMSS